MNDLKVRRFHFPEGGRFLKTAGKTVKGGRLDWEAEVERMLVETAPWIADANLEWKVAWDEFDTDTGYALGKLAVYNRPALPAVYPAQETKMQQFQMDEPATQAVIPIFVENQKLANLDIFVDPDGMVHRLTEKRWNEFVPMSPELGAPDPNAPGTRTTDQYALPESAAGMDRGMGVTFKMGEEKRKTGFPLLEEVLPYLQPYDQERMRKLASDPAILAGFSASRALPVIREMMKTATVSTADYDSALIGTLPTNLLFIERIQPGPQSPFIRRFRAALVSDRYYAPKYIEGDFPTLVRALEQEFPGQSIERRIATGQDTVIQLQRRRTASPVIVEEIDFTAERAEKPGSYLLMEKDGSIAKMDVVQNAYEFDGKASGCRLMVGEQIFAMQPDAWGKLLEAKRSGMSVEFPNAAPTPKGCWVSICNPLPSGDRYTVPIKVRQHLSVMGETFLCGETYRGEFVCLRFIDGVRNFISADGLPWPDLAAGEGYAPIVAPGDARIVRLGQQVQLMDDPKDIEMRLRAYLTFGAKVSGTTRMRFDDSESPRYLVIRHDPTSMRSGAMADGEVYREDDWTVIGRMAEPITGQDNTPGLTMGKVEFILSVLGCTTEQASGLMAKAKARGQITVAGLSPTRRVIDEGGKVNVEFIEKMAELAVQIREMVPDELRDRLFKAASCCDPPAAARGVRAALADPEFVDRLTKTGTAVGMIARAAGEFGIEKTAEVFSGPESIDLMLGLSVLNERSVTTFLRHLPRMKAAEDNMAELLMMCRQGLSGVNGDDVSEGLKSINECNEQLENLESKIQNGRTAYPE